ncbi:hypothetical protein EI94DRAFT_1837241 [Lactarius quietus]|nr:hypothetical protein EI94DRAFT_1837241 [Lactarius quietus]
MPTSGKVEMTQAQPSHTSPASPAMPPVRRAPSQRSRANSLRDPPQVEEVPMRELPRAPRTRSKSTPQKVPPMDFTGGEGLPQMPIPSRPRTKSSVGPAKRNRSSSMSADQSKAPPRRPALSNPSRRPLHSTVRQALPEHFKCVIVNTAMI